MRLGSGQYPQGSWKGDREEPTSAEARPSEGRTAGGSAHRAGQETGR